MNSAQQFDVIVIGAGPGGEGASMQSAKLGKRVAVIERMSQVGGACTHFATIPSKALRQAIWEMISVNQSPLFQAQGININFSFPDLRKLESTVVKSQESMRRTFYDRNGVELFYGSAYFKDPHTIEVRGTGADCAVLTAKDIVIATGSRPHRPANIDFTHPRILDSDTVLGLEYTPRSITIYGAGVVGCEYASMFRNLNVKVNLVNTRARLLEFLDDEITDALSYHLRDRGVLIRHMETYSGIEATDTEVSLHLQSGKLLKSDVLLWANGRSGNTEEMGLEGVGITPNARGQIDVDDSYQTKVQHIYAVGDVCGKNALASVAYDQGRYVATHMSGKPAQELVRDFPTGIYTMPEISSVGQTERDLTKACVPYEVGHAIFKSVARAQIIGQTVGMLKLLFHRETLQILGIHCFGANACEIIHIGQAIMAQKGEANTLMYFINTTFNYPSMAEAYRVAALNGFNRL